MNELGFGLGQFLPGLENGLGHLLRSGIDLNRTDDGTATGTFGVGGFLGVHNPRFLYTGWNNVDGVIFACSV